MAFKLMHACFEQFNAIGNKLLDNFVILDMNSRKSKEIKKIKLMLILKL